MSSRKNMKALWVLSMAAAATLGAKAAHGATLTLYYDNINVLSGTDPQSYGYAAGNNVGGVYSGPTTINVAVGDAFEFGIDAVVTNNVNRDAGKDYGAVGHDLVQPSYLGLANLNFDVPSTDTNASKLAPNIVTPAIQTFQGVPDYQCTSSLNNASGTETDEGSNNGATPAPNWVAYTQGSVWGTFGENTVTNAGAVATTGSVGPITIFQGNGTQANTTAGLANIAQYGSPTASYATATDFFDSLSYTAVGTGTVTLSPYYTNYYAGYWENTQAGSASVAPGYEDSQFTKAGDVVGTLPVLVINITTAPSNHAILSLAACPPASNYGSNEGTVTVTGENSGYTPGYLAVTPAATSYVQVNGFIPGTDEEIYALDVLVNGIAANSAQIAVLVSAIDGIDGIAPASGVVAASNTWTGLEPTVTGPDPFVGSFNLFLDTGDGAGSPAYAGWDVSQSNDSNLVGYTVSEVAVVPEPMSVGLLAVGGLGLLTKRPRRQRRNQ